MKKPIKKDFVVREVVGYCTTIKTDNDRFAFALCKYSDYVEKKLQEANIILLSQSKQMHNLSEENKKLKQSASILNSLDKKLNCPECDNKLKYIPRIYHCNHCGSDFN